MTTSIRIFLLCITLCVVQWGHSKDTPPSYTLIVFEGSDWCVNCRRLQNDVLEKTVFQEFLTQKEIVVEKIDFPQRKELSETTQSYNATIAEKYGFKGVFPTLILVDHSNSQFYTFTYTNESVAQMMVNIEHEMTQSK